MILTNVRQDYIYKTVVTVSGLLLCCKLCSMLWTKTLLLSSIMLVYCQLDNISFVISKGPNISSNRRLVGCCTVFATSWIKSSSTQFLRVLSSLSQLSSDCFYSPDCLLQSASLLIVLQTKSGFVWKIWHDYSIITIRSCTQDNKTFLSLSPRHRTQRGFVC